jgi:hypothetical protein
MLAQGKKAGAMAATCLSIKHYDHYNGILKGTIYY